MDSSHPTATMQNGYWGAPSGPYPQQTPVQSQTLNAYPPGQFFGPEHVHHSSEVLDQYTPHVLGPFSQQPHASSQHPSQGSGPYPSRPSVAPLQQPPLQQLPTSNRYPSQTSGEYASHASTLHPQQLRYPSQASGWYPPQASGLFPQQPHASNLHPSQTAGQYPSHASVPHFQPPHMSSHSYLHASYPREVSPQYPLQSHGIYAQRPPTNETSQHPHHGQHHDPSRPYQPFVDPAFIPAGPAQRGQRVGNQVGHNEATMAPHFAPGTVPTSNDTPTRPNTAPSPHTNRTHPLNAHNQPQASNVSNGIPQPAVPADPHPPPNVSTGPTHSTSSKPHQSSDGETSAKPSNTVPLTEQPTVVLPGGQREAASEPKEGFVPPLDMGPTATYDDVVSLWEGLSSDDHQILIQLWMDMERQRREEVDKMDVESPRLFSIGSSEPKSSKKPPKTRRKRADSRRPPATAPPATAPPTTAPSSDAPPPTAAPSTDTGNAPRPHTFKTVRVEDYESDSDSDDDEGDVVPIASHLKGKERAVDQEQESPSSPEHQIPTLNVRPGTPVRKPNHASPVSAVLNAFHMMGERMERLETSVTQGLKHMDDKISGLADSPANAKAPQNPLGQKTKGPKAAVAKLLAARNGTNTIPLRTRVHPNLNPSTQPSSTPMLSSTPVPPRFGVSRQHPASTQTTPGFSSAQQHTQHPMSTPVPPTANAVYAGARGVQHPTMAWQVPPRYGGGCAGQQDTPYPMSTGVPQAGASAGHQHSTPTQAEVELSAEDIQQFNKLCRKYIRRHLWNELLRIKGPTELPTRCPPLTDDEFEQYMRIKERVINADNFRIDFTRGWGRCAFNAEARSFFAHHFVLSVRGGMYQNPPLPAHWVTETMIAEVLDKVVTHVFRLYSEHSKAPTVQQQAKELRDMERKRSNTRRDTLFKWRLETLVKLRLDHHLILFADIEAAHLSSDEPAFGTDDRQSQFKLYYIVEAAWQSRAFKKFVRALDQWYLYHSRPKVGLKQRGGNLPRVREELPKGKARVVDSIAPRGLWRNCYDEDWVKNLKVSEREDLNMIDEDYDFTLPPPPPIPVEFLARRATTSSSNTRRSAQAGACATSPPFNTFAGPGMFTGPSTSLQPTSPPAAPAPAACSIPESSAVRPAPSNPQSAPAPATATFTSSAAGAPSSHPGAAKPAAVASSVPGSAPAPNA